MFEVQGRVQCQSQVVRDAKIPRRRIKKQGQGTENWSEIQKTHNNRSNRVQGSLENQEPEIGQNQAGRHE